MEKNASVSQKGGKIVKKRALTKACFHCSEKEGLS